MTRVIVDALIEFLLLLLRLTREEVLEKVREEQEVSHAMTVVPYEPKLLVGKRKAIIPRKDVLLDNLLKNDHL